MVIKAENIWKGWWRTAGKPSDAVPIGARSAGHAWLQPFWKHPCGRVQWFNFYWGLSGEVAFTVNGVPSILKAEHIFIHVPGSELGPYPINSKGAYRWMTLDGPFAGELLKKTGLLPGPVLHAGKCPEGLFEHLELSIQDISICGELKSSAAAYEIITIAAGRLAGKYPSEDTEAETVSDALKLIEQNCASPSLNVGWLSRKLRVHRSTLSRLFRRKTGIAPSEYIYRMRLKKAFMLLREKGRTIRQTAFECGFSDPAYFSRCVSREMKVSPRDLKKLM